MILRTFRLGCDARGFTLVELIVVMVIMGVVAGMVAIFVLRPVQGYVDLSRRATLVDSAESALRRMTRDIRLALPNSVRVTITGSGFLVELLPIVDGARYASAEATACENLDFTAADASFDILGTFPTIIATPVALPLSHRLVINNQGITGNDVYADAGSVGQLVITPAGTSITIDTGICGGNPKHHIALSAAHQFRSESPRDRLFLITTPVTYLCDTSAGVGTLVRYAGYPIQALQPPDALTLNALAGVTSARVADRLSACSAATSTPDVLDRGLVTLTLTLAEQGEQITLTHQVQLDNSR